METPRLSNLTDPNYGKPVKEQNPLIQQLGLPHVSSFNYMITSGLNSAVRALDPVEFTLKEDRYTFIIDDAHLSCPLAPKGTIGLKDNRIKPSECRQRATTYKGKLTAKVTWKKNGRVEGAFEKDMGNVPIMLKSKCCHLDYMSPKELVKSGEHEQEWGGYFIVKGHERLIRMLMMTRRNYPIAIKRSGWKGRGELFSDLGVTMRCVANDQTSTTNVLHYVTDGTAKLMFSNRRNLFYVPLVLLLKCLLDTSDLIMYQKLVRGYENDTWYINCIQNMLRSLHEEGLHTHHACKSYLGKMFRPKYYQCPEWFTDIEVANYVIRRSILIHLDKPEDKFNILAFMTQKLFVAAQDKCTVEGADSVMMQELLLGGHLYLQIIKEKLQLWLYNMKTTILKYASSKSGFIFSQAEITTAAKRCGGLENAMEHFLSTGSITSPSGLGLMQDKGLTIVAENINRMRYMSHFRAVHRGAFFQEMRTTEVRQLLPDAWGFICPVHTPDGAPCGLLNHLTTSCTVTDVPDAQKVKNIKLCLAEMGMEPINHVTKLDVTSTYTVLLDGQVLGYIRANMMDKIVNKLRKYKVEGEKVPNMLEIVWVPIKTSRSQFPGLFLFTGPARMMRPVFSAVHQTEEFIGSFEQVYMEICVKADKAYPGLTTHVELSQTEILSNLAKLIPMPDCNQSPRNMYQCQMGKQTMGTPCHNWGLQAETKLYRLQTPASPFFRPVHYDNLGMDDFAMGTNAIVAVVSFTGYDMEDAMMINKMSEERGLAHGSIYKSQFIELEHPTSHFSMDPDRPELAQFLDSDGLPYHGRKMQDDEPLYCYYSVDESKYVVRNFTSKEECYVDNIRLCGDFDSRAKQIACITFRVPRNPTVGDKFASRAGQKGILSMRWPMENLPFTETGMVPDIVFNPHGFPSRMTIAMIIEIMAGKSAAIHGMVHDATPFKFSENQSAAEYFEKLLEKAGYNAHGLETMYSGIDGSEMSAQIFTGIVHYQRLRHMVSDKWQVRSTGPIDILTRQPLKGRKRGGGVRFGEMERDCLISHGSSFLLEDRLFHNSDKYRAYICTACGSILSSLTMLLRPGDKPHLEETMEKCTLCDSGKDIAEVEIPYIFKHFVTQLASCNITVKIGCKTV